MAIVTKVHGCFEHTHTRQPHTHPLKTIRTYFYMFMIACHDDDAGRVILLLVVIPVLRITVNQTRVIHKIVSRSYQPVGKRKHSHSHEYSSIAYAHHPSLFTSTHTRRVVKFTWINNWHRNNDVDAADSSVLLCSHEFSVWFHNSPVWAAKVSVSVDDIIRFCPITSRYSVAVGRYHSTSLTHSRARTIVGALRCALGGRHSGTYFWESIASTCILIIH